MILRLQARSDDGKYIDRSVMIGEFAETALSQIIEDGTNHTQDGWWWLRQWISMVCIGMAKKESGNPTRADLWYERYKAIRGIQ